MEMKLNDFTNAIEDPEALFEILEKLGNSSLKIKLFKRIYFFKILI